MNQPLPIQVIATIGPATSDRATIAAMLEAGLSLVRLNFSWGTYAEHRSYVETIRREADNAGVQIPFIQDLSGPRVKVVGGRHSHDPDSPAFTDKDRRDLQAFADLEFEYVALSFVRDAEDVAELRAFLEQENLPAKIIAKIERQEALTNLDAIMGESDGIMIARGDLGRAVPLEKLPFIKQDILVKAAKAAKPAIVATDMLTSMLTDPDPSRADVSDIADAVVDGTSATMLSAETATGQYPVECVALMRRVVDEAVSRSNVVNPNRF